MGLLDGTTQQQYYQGNDYGNYQFVSLEDIINQFMVVYVGDEKIINKANRIDVAFHAQRALAELSFDTFKSFKSQEIVIPASLTMLLPHDYVNYTRVLWTDSSGIKHPLYPTRDTQNPFSIVQETDGSYDFSIDDSVGFLSNYNFEDTDVLLSSGSSLGAWVNNNQGSNPVVDDVSIVSNKLQFTHGSKTFASSSSINSRIYLTYQQVDITGCTEIDLTATATFAAAGTGKGAGLMRIGVSTLEPTGSDITNVSFNQNITNPQALDSNGVAICSLNNDNIFNLRDSNDNRAMLEFTGGEATTQTISTIDISGIPLNQNGRKLIYVLVTSQILQFTTASDGDGNESINTVDSVVLSGDQPTTFLQENTESTTWSNYKSNTPSENDDDYEDDIYWPMDGGRYGLDPQHAQANGSFFIDDRLGKIHFSSNVSGKTVVLDYISDSLGTDGEMQVHKFAEEAMYRSILYGVAASYPYTQQLIPRLKKEKFAAIRTAKLRLSNIKLEELTQTLRGKSKQIKH